MSSNEKAYEERQVAFYSATVNAWYGTKLERDKHLLALASAGIGLLVTLATTIGVKTLSVGVVYILAVVSFLICIIAILVIFHRNADYLERVIHSETATDPVLKRADKLAECTFVCGIIFTLAIGLFSGIDKFNRKETPMGKQSTSNIQFPDPDSQESSFEGAPALKPDKPPTKPIQEKPNQTKPDDVSPDEK